MTIPPPYLLPFHILRSAGLLLPLFLPFAIFFYGPNCQHDVSVRVAGSLIVDGKVGAHSSIHKIFLDERSDKGKLLRSGQLNRQGHFNFPGKLGGAGFLDLLHAVPEGGAVLKLRRGVRGQHDFNMDNAAFACVVMGQAVPLFDVSQTDGKPLPSLAADLFGNVRHFEAFMEALKRSAPVPLAFEEMDADTDGYFSSSQQRIAIRQGMSEVQTVSAAVHEIAHSKLHNFDVPDNPDAPLYQEVEGKKKDYAEYRRSREEIRELLAAKANVDRLMGYGEERQNDREKEQGQDR